MKQQPKRYDNLAREVAELPAATKLMEIGTCAGRRARLIIEAAKTKHAPHEITYYGFDLFQASPPYELSPRVVAPPLQQVQRDLGLTGATIELHQGDTRQVLPRTIARLPKMDLVFVDGGHSEETVCSDWACVQRLMHRDTVVVFDDYWNFPGGGGCKFLIDGLRQDAAFNVTLLQPADEYPRPYGTLRTQLARVTLR